MTRLEHSAMAVVALICIAFVLSALSDDHGAEVAADPPEAPRSATRLAHRIAAATPDPATLPDAELGNEMPAVLVKAAMPMDPDAF